MLLLWLSIVGEGAESCGVLGLCGVVEWCGCFVCAMLWRVALSRVELWCC